MLLPLLQRRKSNNTNDHHHRSNRRWSVILQNMTVFGMILVLILTVVLYRPNSSRMRSMMMAQSYYSNPTASASSTTSTTSTTTTTSTASLLQDDDNIHRICHSAFRKTISLNSNFKSDSNSFSDKDDWIIMMTINNGFYDFFLNWYHHYRQVMMDTAAETTAAATATATANHINVEDSFVFHHDMVLFAEDGIVLEKLQTFADRHNQEERTVGQITVVATHLEELVGNQGKAFRMGDLQYAQLITKRPSRMLDLVCSTIYHNEQRPRKILYVDVDTVWKSNPFDILNELLVQQPIINHDNNENNDNGDDDSSSMTSSSDYLADPKLYLHDNTTSVISKSRKEETTDSITGNLRQSASVQSFIRKNSNNTPLDILMQLDAPFNLCTGFMALSNINRRVLLFLDAWEKESKNVKQYNILGDQGAFNALHNRLLQQTGGRLQDTKTANAPPPPLISSRTSKSYPLLLEDDGNNIPNIRALSQTLLPNGELFFDNYSSEQQDKVVVVHANYILGHDEKRKRLAMLGLWKTPSLKSKTQ